MIALVVVTTAVALFLLRDRKKTYTKGELRRRLYIVSGASIAVLALLWWFTFSPTRAEIDRLADITEPNSNCNVELPQLKFGEKPVNYYCLPILQPGAGNERLITGTFGKRVGGDLWLEVQTPVQDWTASMPNETKRSIPIEDKPKWYFTPVIDLGDGKWRASATLGTQEDWTPKWHYVRLISCGPEATERILTKSYQVPESAGKDAPNDKYRYAYPWGNRCEKQLDAVAVLFRPDPEKLAQGLQDEMKRESEGR
jgi:hypothetical protein